MGDNRIGTTEKKVGKTDVATLVFRRENGDKIVVRGACFDGEQVTVLKGQVFEARREEGSVVFVVKDPTPVPAFSRVDLRRAVEKIDRERDLDYLGVDFLIEELSRELKVPV